MKRIKLTIGDIFEVPLEDNSRGYFQYIAIDDNQLRSDVIRVFSRRCSKSDEPKFADLVGGEVDFYAHCVIKAGVKYGFWQKVGHVDDVGPVDAVFRSTKDFGRDWIEVSERWEVWGIGQPPKYVGKLTDDLLSAEQGEVFPPYEIVHRMNHGRYEQTFHR